MAEAARTGATVQGVAKRYGIAPSVVFRWRRDLAEKASPAFAAPVFAEVKLGDAGAGAGGAAMPLPAVVPAPPIVVERPAPGIEIDLKGGRRVRFDRETDPEAIRALVALLEGEAQ